MTTQLDVNAITCRYGAKEIFANLSFHVDKGSIACLLGPSGCGKTTALRAIAGFEPIYGGRILLDGLTLSSPNHALPPEQRHVGMVFQDYALFPHLNVSDNIAFGLPKHTRAERERSVAELLDLVRMQDCAKSFPHQLSGGQQQRVALARALAPKPKLLLLDEPFSNLDTELRRSLSLEVRAILKQHGTTAILVTHDQTEAFNVADVIGVMAEGKLLQWGTARQLYHEPATPFVAAFVSSGAFISGRRVGPQRLATVFGEVTLPEGMLTASQVTTSAHSPQNGEAASPNSTARDGNASPANAAPANAAPANASPADGSHEGQMLDLLLRPWNVVYAETGLCPARVMSHQFHGAYTLTALQLSDGTLLASMDERLSTAALGSTVTLALDPKHLRVFPR